MPNSSTEPNPEVIYLLGFASDPKSSKAIFFKNKLAEIGIKTHVPDLNVPSFEAMTLSSQLGVVDDVAKSIEGTTPIVIIGSSMGGLLATIKAAEIQSTETKAAKRSDLNLKALILLAPGFGLAKRWPQLFGEQNLDTWKERGVLDVFNYAVEKTLPLSYKFYEDIINHVTDTELLRASVPTLIFHGRADETVPFTESETFAERNPDFVTLYPLDDDHQLLASLEDIWSPCKELLRSLAVR